MPNALGAEVVAVHPARDPRPRRRSDSRDSPNSSKPNSLPRTTSACGAAGDVVVGDRAAELAQAIEQAHAREYARPPCDMLGA